MNHVNKTFRMLCPAHQFIKFQKSYIYNFFIFGLVFRKWVGGGGEKVGLHFYFTGTYDKRCIEGFEILEVRIYDQTMVEAVN